MKGSYRLSAAAEEDLKRIYRRGFQEFGEEQADRYFRDFFDRFELLSEEPLLYPVASDVAQGLRKSVCGSDTIYYEIIDGAVVVQFILGRQDITQRIRDRE